ncbi:Protein-L-isoaspartate O-methyltransferase [Actinokineospora spheciospongiae]|uniref:Protein-L-isoaspartate O-methyltransferase n=1 Tax=Actinokineospora spheciospongiae TaxID=909613 RepID=W7ISB5_9PSEU|nr:erythromycin esterase family protein [Actinokineospora spheciospongiae]EWC63238.1 Protein-L-isoaspartate O-methyltransferase [Actinokineospora spheciospongiae]PWW66932.1 erythromycin esterase-like protein [Actinokineospora spheciospongiae]
MSRYGDEVAALAAPLTDAGDLDVLLDRVGDARVVMVGEASHGTHEFYRWREALTRRLITEKGFSFVAVEGDWPDCGRVDRAVRCSRHAPEDPRAALAAFERWPTWMWANEEVVDFCRWLRTHNSGLDIHRRVGFHGLDVYSLWESLREILTHLREHDPAEVPAALAAYRCFEPYGENARYYASATRLVPTGCENEVVDLLVRLRGRAAGGGAFGAWQNAEVVAGAERYYRSMVRGGGEAWNVRDRHMDETLDRLLTHHGPGAKGVVWAHNTHVGDARATDMAVHGEVNLGQLARERYGADQVVLIGFGSHRGTVIAGDSWGAPMREMPVPAARPGSLEDVLHAAAPTSALFVFPRDDRPDLLTTELGHRAVGVVYHPEREHRGNYVPTVLGDRYDAFVWIDRTRALHPLHTRQTDALEPQTHPTGT